MVYKSAVGFWFYLVLALVAFIVYKSLAPTVSEQGFVNSIGIISFSLVITMGLPIWILFTTNYRVEDDNLIVRSGPVKWAIPLSSIQSVEATRALWSSPALSLDRLRINYEPKKSVLVSPKDREGFLNAIGQSLIV